MNILIAGGTGFIGQALIKQRQGKCDKITVVGRSAKKIHRLFGTSVASVSWQQLTTDIIAEQNVIINLAGANIGDKRWTVERKQELINSRVETTRQLAAFCSEIGTQGPRLFNASAIGVYNSNCTADDETKSPLVPTSFLQTIGLEWEQALASAIQAGVKVTTLRFGVVLADSGGMMAKLTPSFKWGLGQKIGTGQQWLSWVSLVDVLGVIDFLLKKPELDGTFNVVAPEPVRQENFADNLAAHFHRTRFLSLPSIAIKLLFAEMGKELLLSGQRVLPTRLQSLNYPYTHPSLNALLSTL